MAVLPISLSFYPMSPTVFGNITSILGALQPVTAVILGAIFLDEHLSLESIAGIVLILIAVTIIVLKQRTKRH